MKKRFLSIILTLSLMVSVAIIPNVVSASAYTVDTTGYKTSYSEDFSAITNDDAGKAKLNEFWELQDGSFGGDTTTKVVDGALHFFWIAGRQLTSNASFQDSIISFDAKLDSAAGPAAGQDIKGFAIRQSRNDGCFQSENDKYSDGTQPGLGGILLRMSANGILVVVDDTTVPAGNDGVTSWSINSFVALPSGVSLDTFQKITVVDKGTTIDFVVGTELLAKVELSNLVDGIYKTATIKDAAGNTLATTTTANVPELGKIAFGKRTGDMFIDNINIMVKDDSAPAEVDKDIVKFDLGAAQPIALVADGKIGQSFTASDSFNTITLGICTWNTAKAGYTFELRKDGPNGAIVYKHAATNAVDNSNPVYIVGNLPAGTYYLELNKLVATAEPTDTEPDKMSQMGVWASKDDSNPYAGGSAYLDGAEKTYDINFNVKYIPANKTAVGNEATQNPGTSDLGALQVVVMAAASAVVALRRKK